MSSNALLVIDMLNRYEHEDAELLRASARDVVPVISRLVGRARQANALIVYVNDNHGDWTAGRAALTQRALQGSDPGLVAPVAPGPDVPFLVKARHSAFYATQLEYLLREQQVERLVLCGQVTEQCILYTALDAYIRGFEVFVPRDAVAHIHLDLAEAALRMMARNMHASIGDADSAVAVLAD